MAQFRVIDTKIYAPDGNEFIVKGTNMFAWEGTDSANSIVIDWGFNAIRVPNFLLGSYDQPHPEVDEYRTNQQIVQRFTQGYSHQKTVVIFDAHDRVGRYYQGEEFETLKQYWREMAILFKDNPYVWFNLHNEPGKKNANPQQWIAYHRELIDIIRAEGANNIIVIDGEAWGQDFYSQTILNHGFELIDENENILFSIHVYDQWNQNDIGIYFDQLHERNIPIMVGEYGAVNNTHSTLAASQQMMTAAQQREIGRMVWVFSANDRNDLTIKDEGHGHYFDGANVNDLTPLGQLVWNDLQRIEDLESLDSSLTILILPALAIWAIVLFGIRIWPKSKE
ncbi:MAG: glycoside hydrolase family 5 protein [Cyanobacteria bacterium P01_F01_bin.150]